MAKTEKRRNHRFYILNVKLRKQNSIKDLSSEDYVRLFKNVVGKKLHAESSPGKHCIFRFMFEEKQNDEIIYLYGTFAQFTYIENERWFNIDSLDIDQEFKVPDGLFPDAVITDFVFVPKAHRFCFRVASDIHLSPYPIKRFLEHALDKASRADELVQVDVESTRASIETILAAPEIRKLIIDVNYSNSDDTKDIQKFFENDIKRSNSKRIKIEVTQKPNESIDVGSSDILTGALETSVSNGEAIATIIDQDNKVQTIKTSDFPRKESIFGTLNQFPQSAYDKIRSLFKRNGN